MLRIVILSFPSHSHLDRNVPSLDVRLFLDILEPFPRIVFKRPFMEENFDVSDVSSLSSDSRVPVNDIVDWPCGYGEICAERKGCVVSDGYNGAIFSLILVHSHLYCPVANLSHN